MKRIFLIFILLLSGVACDSTSITPTAETGMAITSPIVDESPTEPVAPTHTPTDMPTVTPTLAPTDPPTATPTDTPTLAPTTTPMPIMDNWQWGNVPEIVRDGLANDYIVFINKNNSETILNLSTAEPTVNAEAVYFASPRSLDDRILILELAGTTGNQVYPARHGNAMAYFVQSDRLSATGLYVLDIANGLSGRILPIDSLTQRGLYNAPAWSPDGTRLAVAIQTQYDLDIYVFEMATSVWQPLVQHSAFDFWPAWSPDGRYLAFVSDRERCAGWIPGEPGMCDPTQAPPPNSGHVYVLDLQTSAVSRLSETPTVDPPYWINSTLLAFSGGDPFDLLNPSRTLWVGAVPEMTSREVRWREAGAGRQLNVSESWMADGSRVIFQHIGQAANRIVIMGADGRGVATLDSLSFARFTMATTWSPDGMRLAVGGARGHCPYGIRVFDENFALVAAGSQPRSMCSPIFSPDGNYIAFTGFSTTAADGRVDVYSSTSNGYDARNLTSDLRGQMTLLGWVGP